MKVRGGDGQASPRIGSLSRERAYVRSPPRRDGKSSVEDGHQLDIVVAQPEDAVVSAVGVMSAAVPGGQAQQVLDLGRGDPKVPYRNDYVIETGKHQLSLAMDQSAAHRALRVYAAR